MAHGGHDVKSKAVVKYAAIETPAQFRQLQCDTDLKQPPANWLQGNSKWESYVRDLSFGKGHFFSSFRMGHCYPDLTGEIDVVSDAENIKTLLKIPYSKGHVSMMVHRVGNTLLLDDFDIHRHLLRQQQKDWKWLRKFYYETVVQNMQSRIKDQMRMVKKNKSRDHLQNMNMFSKFLYYSIGKSEDNETCVSQDNKSFNQQNPTGAALRTSATPLPPDPQTENINPAHQRTQEWTFEDIRMLVGTDLPIFGGSTHPCISLRLRDMREPINVLTGLDYWLDNLICNVPELAMCYHLDGIVKSYKLMKTEDIPKLPKSEFSPSVIKDVSQNILSFLKSNATKEGHTYWLFKGHGDDVVKLYDLTTLCDDLQDDATNNPFTVPVGMLLYRVARNMRTNQGRKKSGTIRTLLENCLLLLDAKVHAQVVTSAQYLLSDLYISDSVISPEESPDTSDDSDIEEENIQDRSLDEEPDAPMTSVDVQTLCLPEKANKPDRERHELVRYPPVSGNRDERCVEARTHITQGLRCLDQNIEDLDKRKKRNSSGSLSGEETQARCDPSTAIPLHYTPIKDDKTTANQKQGLKADDNGLINATSAKQSDLSAKNAAHQVSVFNRTTLPSESWHRRSKMLLLRKAVLAFYGIAEAKLAVKSYGAAWKYLQMALHCHSAVRALTPDLSDNILSSFSAVLSLVGDLHLLMSHNPQGVVEQQNDFGESTDEDEKILASTRLIVQKSDFDWLEPFSVSVQENLERSCRCYQMALEASRDAGDAADTIESIGKRLGNILNELGVEYMNTAAYKMAELCRGRSSCVSEMSEFVQKSGSCFTRGVTQFQALGDSLNVSLLYSNLARLQRVSAQAHRQDGEVTGGGEVTCGDRKEFTPQEAQAFSKAQDYYSLALASLGNREANTEIWDSINWELSSTCFTMATLLQDYAPLSTKAQEQVEREVIKLMEKALSLCDVSTESPRRIVCLYRAATIHHRLASLHHNAYRNQVDDKKLRYLRTEAEDHYTQAVELFSQTEGACELLRVQLERVALYEYQLQNQTSPITRARTLHHALDALRACAAAVDMLAKQVTSESVALTTDAQTSLQDEGHKLTGILVTRLQYVAMNLVKCAAQKSKKISSSSSSSPVDIYKSIYSAVLKSGAGEASDLVTRCHHLSETLRTIDKLCSEESGGVQPGGDGKCSSSVSKKR